MWQSSRFRALVCLTHLVKVGDIFLILCLVCGGVILWTALRHGSNRAKYCIISVNGKDAYKLLLSDSQEVKVNGPIGESIVKISNGKVRMEHSPCPLKMCVHQGAISRPGEMIICVPNRIMIRIIPHFAGEVDAITW